MLEYKLVRLPSEAGLTVWENFLNSYAGDRWKLVHWSAGTIGSGPGYVILERMKSSDQSYSEAYRLARFGTPPKSKSNPIGGTGLVGAALDTEL